MRKFLSIISLFFLVFGCKEKYTNYNSFVFTSESIMTQNDSISIPFKKMYNGDYLYRVNDNLYKKGNYVDGINVGHWTYNVLSGKSYSFDWRSLPVELSQGEINAPKSWAIFPSHDSLSLITFDLLPNLQRRTLTDNYFTILRHKNPENKSLESYNEYYKKSIHTKDVISKNYFVISIDGVQFLFNRFIIKRDGQTLFLCNINGQFDGDVVDVSMVTKSEDVIKNQLIFLEVVRTLKIGNRPFLPRVGVLEMKIVS